MTHRGVQAIGVALVLQAIQIPQPTGFVNDFAGVVSAETEARLQRIIEDVRAKSGGDIAVVTLRDLGQRSPEEIALRIGREWEVGGRGDPGDPRRNAGAVILLVPKETNSSGRGACRIETGRGVEGFITDGEAFRFCTEATPLFAAQDYDAGIALVTQRVAAEFAREFGFVQDTSLAARAPPPPPPAPVRRGIPPQTLFLLLIFVVLMLNALGRRRGRRRGCGVSRSSFRWAAGRERPEGVGEGVGGVGGEVAADSAGLVASVGVADSAAVGEAPAGDHMATMTLDDLVAQLHKAYGDDLVTVVLYGSAAAGEHIPKRSDLNVLVLVRALSLDRLRVEAAVARAWSGAGNPPPLTLTEEEWKRSADIFAMEYADILERHRVLYGTPPFDGIVVDRAHLRFQLEHETMGTLVQFRQGILAAGGEETAQIRLLEGSLSTIMVIFRATLRLHGEVSPTDYVALSRAVGSTTGMDPEPFLRAVRHARGEERLTPRDVGDVLAGYLTGLQRLVPHLDQFGGGR